jgi:acyl-coenzyme A synthetase/AMP-(fatty) acid ligase
MTDTLFRLWTATVRRAPAAIAVVDASSGRKWTRAELDDTAAAWADSFARMAGKSPIAGRRVAMSLPNGAEWFQVFLGLLSLGAAPAPIDPSEPEDAQVAAALLIGARWIWRAGGLRAVSPAGRARPARRPARGECLVKLSSGSSGRPRGLSATHAQMAADGRQICASMGIGPDDSSLAVIPLGYSYGLGNLVVPLIVQGSRVICLASALPHAVASDARRLRPTVFPAVPPVLKALAASDVPRGSLASVRLVISAGSPLAPEVGRAFAAKFGVPVHGFYGTSETGGIAFDSTGDATLAGRSVGTPLSGVRITLGSGGRFRVSSPAVLGRGHFSPADRATLNERGELVLLGRTDRVVKVGGRRVDLAEIEAVLKTVPGIRDAFALAPGADGPSLCAAVATDLRAAEIRRLLRSRLAAWKIPARLLSLRHFPRTARGKSDTRKLRQVLTAPRTVTSTSTLSAERHMSAPR